ncbi:MAG: GTPase, partial [Desulfurivibrionaceae bacterium]
GYTNAGKSTLFNALTTARVDVADKLFATLDPTSRRLRFPRDMEVIITDTVGFIRNLPEELMQSFKATLEELHEADLIIHVVDVSNSRFAEQIKVVDDILADLGLNNIPSLRLLNKIDLVDPEQVETIRKRYQGIPISAVDPDTFGPFLEEVPVRIRKNRNQ